MNLSYTRLMATSTATHSKHLLDSLKIIALCKKAVIFIAYHILQSLIAVCNTLEDISAAIRTVVKQHYHPLIKHPKRSFKIDSHLLPIFSGLTTVTLMIFGVGLFWLFYIQF